MSKLIALAATTLSAVVTALLVAPSASAMVPGPDGGSGGSSTTAAASTGVALWQVLGIALIAVVIGGVGAYFAQRTHRHADADAHSISIA